MTGWDAFEELHGRALEEAGLGTRLNSAAGAESSAGSGNADLVVGDGTLRGAADVIETSLVPDAESLSGNVLSLLVQNFAFRGWAVSEGMAEAGEQWGRRVGMLTQRLQEEARGLRDSGRNILDAESETIARLLGLPRPEDTGQ